MQKLGGWCWPAKLALLIGLVLAVLASSAPSARAQTAAQPASNASSSGQPAVGTEASAPAAGACGTRVAVDALKAVESLPANVDVVQAASLFPLLPAHATTKLAVYRKFSPDESYRVLIRVLRDGPRTPDQNFDDVRLILPGDLWVYGATSATDFTNTPSIDKTIVEFPTPAGLGYFWPSTRVYVIGCKAGGSAPAFIAAMSTNITDPTVCTAIAAGAAVLFYIAIAVATFRRRSKGRNLGDRDEAHPQTGSKYQSLLRHFDPVVLTAGANGRGSASKLQILFFSLIVFELLLYIFMRTGRLSNLSQTVLLLMGIAGVGAAAAAGTDVTRNRLDFENWAWLVNKKWLPTGGVAEINLARWQDIVTTDGEFDVYRFQMIIFSVVVGVSLMTIGLSDLASFEIPTALLGILGLSQVVYVGGKLVSPPSCAELNTQLTSFRKAEATFREAALAGGGAPADIPALIEHVGSSKYQTYRESAEALRTMFQSTLNVEVSDQKLDDMMLFRSAGAAMASRPTGAGGPTGASGVTGASGASGASGATGPT
jgi:hypothetical protein